MDFVTVRELRSASAKLWERLESGEDLVVTRNGKPFALLVHTAPAEIEEKLSALRAVGRTRGSQRGGSLSQALLAPDIEGDDSLFARDPQTARDLDL
jgi:antitoxin (DNA-binding transcriptional repressor) of toxin-antitoxin stability system